MIKTDEYVKDGDGEGSIKDTGQITEESKGEDKNRDTNKGSLVQGRRIK